MIESPVVPSWHINRLGWPSYRIERFLGHITKEKPEECWNWTGSRTLAGYGQFGFAQRGERSTYAHRLYYELEVGPIPEGHQIHHKCKNRLCVNPAHLEPITPEAHITLHNTEEWAVKRLPLMECQRGHRLEGNNLLLKGDGKRRCKTCADDREHGYAEVNKIARRLVRKERWESKTHCENGHELTPENLILYINKRNGNPVKSCRICKMAAVKRYQQTAKGREAKKRVKARERSKKLALRLDMTASSVL